MERLNPQSEASGSVTFVTKQQAVIHALFEKHRSMSDVARILGLSQIRVREGLVQHQRNRMRDEGLKPPSLKEMLRGDVITRFGVPRSESGGRPAKHVQLNRKSLVGQLRTNMPAAPLEIAAPAGPGPLRFIVTSVEPDGHVHGGFWQNLKAYAADLGARVVVVRTGNVATKSDLVAEYAQFVVSGAILAGGLVDIAADEAVNVRLARPLDGLRHRNVARWTVVPAPEIQLETLPRIRAEGLRVQLTTGAMTVSKAEGSKRRRELGAVIVEVSGDGACHCRHLLAQADGDGMFHDLDAVVSEGRVHRGARVEAITFGDIHHAHLDPAVAFATWGLPQRGSDAPRSLVDRLRPRTMVFHDVCDFEARNAFDARDHYKRFAQMVAGSGDVSAELIATSRFLADTRRDWAESIVVGSNHDNGLLRWLREQDFREDPTNAIFFLQSSLLLHERIAEGRSTDGFFEQTLRRLSPDNLRGVRFLRPEESLKLAGSEAAIHGHLGADGRRGDVGYFERLGLQATLGHTHRPATRGGIYSAGVCNTELAYARGPLTSWAIGHVITYATGARQHLLYDGGTFHA